MKIDIQIFGPLKEYFPSTMHMDVEEGIRTDELVEKLIDQSPAARHVLNSSRIAIGDEIIDNHKPIYEYHEISLLPPSSGG